MDMKKRGLVIVSLILGLFLFSSLVSAAPEMGDVSEYIQRNLNTFVVNANPILQFIVGEVTVPRGVDITPGELLFVKVVILLILLGIVYTAVGKFPDMDDKSYLKWIITLGVSLLAVRFLTDLALVNLIWLPTGVVSISLVTVFLFALYFYAMTLFNSSIIRKVGWCVFIAMMLGLAFFRWDTLDVPGGTEWYSNFGWIYVAAAILSVFAILWDKKIRVQVIHAKSLSARKSQLQARQAQYQVEIDDIERKLSSSRLTRDVRDSLERDRVKLQKLQKKIDGEIAQL